MSLVGPAAGAAGVRRPLSQALPGYTERLWVRPGPDRAGPDPARRRTPTSNRSGGSSCWTGATWPARAGARPAAAGRDGRLPVWRLLRRGPAAAAAARPAGGPRAIADPMADTVVESPALNALTRRSPMTFWLFLLLNAVLLLRPEDLRPSLAGLRPVSRSSSCLCLVGAAPRLVAWSPRGPWPTGRSTVCVVACSGGHWSCRSGPQLVRCWPRRTGPSSPRSSPTTCCCGRRGQRPDGSGPFSAGSSSWSRCWPVWDSPVPRRDRLGRHCDRSSRPSTTRSTGESMVSYPRLRSSRASSTTRTTCA